MRNAFFKKTLFCLFAVVLLVTLLFAACSRKGKDVPVPTGLAIKNEVLTWNAVDGALSYDVKIDETVYSTQETRFPLPITDYEFHEITVRVNTHDGASEYASSLTYTRHATQTVLASLSTPEITMTSNRVMWGTVLNNNGYLIYMGNTVITVAKNATYYDLTFPADGIYYIRMQTLGDGVSYSNSNISNAYAVTVKDGKAPLRKLPKAEFSFDVSTKSLVWTNRYSAEAVDYEIYQEGISLPIETIPADATKVKMTYKPTLNGTKVTYKMRLISNNGLYSPSDFNQSITFPIADSAPTDLAVSLSKGTSAYEISWSAATYCDGYTVEIDGVTYDPTEALSMPIPSGLAEGRHIARVKTHGVGVHYADSIYSEGVVFYLDGKGEMPTPIQTPTAPTLLANEDGESYTVYLTPVEGAAKYRLIFVGASGENTLVAVNDQFELTAGRFDNRNATDAEKTVIGRILGDMETGLHLSVVAIPSDPHYLESAISREAFFSTDGELTATISPDLTFGADGFSWSDIGEETLYEIKLDGAIYDPAELPSLSEGTHRARVRVKKDGALWSNEIIFRAPIDLDAPTDLSLSNGVLSFNPSKNATGYKLFVDGILLQTVSPSDHRITLANYIKQDGEYVLHLVATAGNATLADSAPSRQILYVKNDAPSGTESKPYYLSTATDLWATMRADPTANFLLVGNAVYDFTGFDFSAASAFTFKGTLMGNGATVKGISVTSPLFSALEGATIRDVTFEIDAENFVFSQNGIFAATAKDTTLSGIAFSLSGRTASPETGSFGLLFHTVTGLALRDSSVVCDLTVGNGMKTVFGVIADSFEGTASGVTLSGRVSASGNDVTCGAFAVTGDMTLSELTSSLTLTLNATNQLSIGGISPNGVVKGSHITLKNVISANAAYAEYYGVASESVTMSSSDLGGTVSAQGSSVTIVGVSKTGALSLTDVKVTAALKGKASSELRVAGVADTIPSGAVTTGFSFEGEIDANAPKVTAAGIAFTCVGSFRAKSAGTIKVTGKEAKVSLGAVNAADMTIESAGSITLIKVDDAEVGGAALTSDGKTTLSGRLTVSATECGEVRFGGAIASGDQTVEIGSYEIDGQLAADSIRFGGVGYDAGMVNFSAASLGVNVTLTSEDVKAAGAYLSATSVSVANPSVLSSRIAGIGSGAISGVFGEVGSPLLKDITVSGRLSLVGTGTLYGVGNNVGAVSHIASAVSLYAEGEVDVYGLFRSVSSASDLTLSDATVEIVSDAPTYYAVRTVRNGTLERVTLSGLSLEANPATAEAGDAKVIGLTESAKAISGLSVSSLSYRIGTYARLTFAGVAETMNGEVGASSLGYTLSSDAAEAEIGGAFLEAKGTISLDLGTAQSPLTVNAKGSVRLGCLVLDPSDLTVTDGNAFVAFGLALGADSESTAGGLFANIGGSRSVTISEYDTVVSLSRSGAGKLTFGGAAALCNGTMSGASVDLDVQGGTAADFFGGVIGELQIGTLNNGAARGSLSSKGAVGGLVCNVTYGHIYGGATSASIASDGKAGGVFAVGVGTRVQNVASISRLTKNGAGLFAEGENIIINNAYFAGRSSSCSLALVANNCAATALFVDATLSALPAVGTGALDCEYRSLAYGYTGSELGSAFTADGKRYPFVNAIGSFAENKTLTTKALPSINLTETTDLYSILPRFYDANTPTVTWVDGASLLAIENGVATVTDNGSGTLYGYLSGGVRVYSVFYTASGFLPLLGDGTAESPYLIRDMHYFRYVKDFAESFSSAHFLLDLAVDEVEGAVFTELFTESAPFRGTLDFGGVLFLSPILPDSGILGSLHGATVKGLRLGGTLGGTLLASSAVNATIEDVSVEDVNLTGDTTLVGSAVATTVSGVTFVGQTEEGADFTLIGEMTGGALNEASVALTIYAMGDVTASVIGRATDGDVSKVQALWRVKQAGVLTVALVREDVGSTYTECMTITESLTTEYDDYSVAGLALSADGTDFIRAAVVFSASGLDVSPLVKEGTATYTDTILLATLDEPLPAGVTLVTPENARTLIGALTGYVAGDLPTPIGFDAFGDDNQAEFTLSETEATISDRKMLASFASIGGEKVLSTLVYYTFTGDCAVIEGSMLRPKKDGTGSLIVTNVYGVSHSLAVTVAGFNGFAVGSGTEADPYLIDSTTDFIRMLAREDKNAYYFLNRDLELEITESASFMGVLTSTDHSVDIDLKTDVFLTDARGRIEGVYITISCDSVSAESVGGVFAKQMSGLTISRSVITIDCPTVTIADGTTFGYLAGEADYSKIVDSNVTVPASEITAGTDATIGVLFGTAKDTILRGTQVVAILSMTGEGEVRFGAVGSLSATSDTTYDYDELTEEEYLAYYVDDVELYLTLSATADDLTMGGLAGYSFVTVKSVSGTVHLYVGGGNLTVGGVVGEADSEVTDVDLTVTIDSYETVIGGYVGGIVGQTNHDLIGGNVDASVTLSAQGELYVGGAVGSGANLERLSVTAKIDVGSVGVESLAEALRDPESEEVVLLSAGGAAGKLFGDASNLAVTVLLVRATSAYSHDDLCVLAAGLAGSLSYLNDVEIKGDGTVAATGGRALVGGVAVWVYNGADRVVVGGITTEGEGAETCGLVVGIQSEDGWLDDVFVVIADLDDETPALVGALPEAGMISHARYRSGKAIGTGDEGALTDVEKLNAIDAFYNAALYEAFNEEIWNIAGDDLPTLR